MNIVAPDLTGFKVSAHHAAICAQQCTTARSDHLMLSDSLRCCAAEAIHPHKVRTTTAGAARS